jgi:hypothetical protein
MVDLKMFHTRRSQAVQYVLTTSVCEKEAMVMLQHCGMGHLSFDKMNKVVPDVLCGVDKTISV